MKSRSKSFSPPLNSSALPIDHRLILYLSVVVAATLLVYGNLVRADFCSLDDLHNISLNPSFDPPTAENVAQYWITRSVHGLYIPLTYSVWGVLAIFAHVPTPDAWGGHLNPSVFHLANVVLHAGSALAAFALLENLLRNRGAACIGALLFSLHPLQVEAVGWAAGLKDVLSGLLSLVALWQYVVYAKHETRRPMRAYWVATAALILAMLAKPSAMMTPLIALALDGWWIKRGARAVVISLLPWLALGLICAVNARIVQGDSALESAPLWARPLIAGDTLAFYFGKIIWPVNLAVDYGRKPSVAMAQPGFYLAWLIPAGLTAIAFLLRKREPTILLGVAIFVSAIAPVLGLTSFLYQQFSTTADHYVYLAMLGPALIAGSIAARSNGRAVAAIAVLILLVLGAMTVRQAQVWQNNTALFSHALEITPRSILVMNNLGHGYLVEQRYADAQEMFERVLSIDPANPQARLNLDFAVKARASRSPAAVSTSPASKPAQ